MVLVLMFIYCLRFCNIYNNKSCYQLSKKLHTITNSNYQLALQLSKLSFTKATFQSTSSLPTIGPDSIAAFAW